MASRQAVYSDIDIELTRATDGDILRDTEEDAVINSLINIINTLQGSRRMLPTFASSMQKILFEPIDTVTTNTIKSKLISSIRKWDDRVIIENIIVDKDEDMALYKCTMKFRIKGFREENITTIDFVLRAF